MNVNGSRFELLLGEADWGRCHDGDGEHARTLRSWWELHGSPSVDPDLNVPAWDEDRNELSIRPRLIELPATPSENPLDLEARRCACADRYGNVYRIGGDPRSLIVYSVGSRRESVFWPAAPSAGEDEHDRSELDFVPQPAAHTGLPETYLALAVTTDDYLVVAFARESARGFLSFDLVAGGSPVPTLWPTGIDFQFQPFDMSARDGGGVWVLDRKHRRLWELDCRLAVVSTAQRATSLRGAQIDDFQPLTGELRERASALFPAGIELQGSPPWVVDPVAVETLGDGAVLVLDIDAATNQSRVVRLRREGEVWRAEASNWLVLPDLAHDFLFATVKLYQKGEAQKQLLLATRGGNQVRAYRIEDSAEGFELKGATDLFPLRRFGGRALIAVKGGAHYDSGIDNPVWTPIVQQPRMQFEASAEFVTPVFDSSTIGTTWDRVLLDACLPPDTSVMIWSRGADECIDLPDGNDSPGAEAPQLMGTWLPEPLPHLRSNGPELPWLRSEAARATRRGNGVGTWELLLQNAHGRYLQLKIRLTSENGMSTPRLRALRVWSPRFSYPQRFLPAVYREDTTAGPFLERWLANLESTLTNVEDRIVNLQALFDPRIAPADTLAWLAQWFDVAFDPAWDEKRQRLFVLRAMDFFRWRGTVHGLRLALELAFNPCIDIKLFDGPSKEAAGARQIRIVETYQTRLLGALVAGDPGAADSATGLREVRLEVLWAPEEGNEGLADRHAKSQGRKGATPAEQITPFALVPPPINPHADSATNEKVRDDWRKFCAAVLGFVPSVGAEEQARWRNFLDVRHGAASNATLPRDWPTSAQSETDWREFNQLAGAGWVRQRWQDFLARRHRRIERLNRAYETAWPGFDQVALPDVLPQTRAAQTDWLQFERQLLPMHRTAHRFSVLLPVADVTADPFEMERRLGLARRIVELEKPAHTVFDVRFYWAFFRVGEARLGIDTQIGAGSRAPELIPAAVLGRAYVGASFVGGAERPKDGDRLLTAC